MVRWRWQRWSPTASPAHAAAEAYALADGRDTDHLGILLDWRQIA